MDPYYFEAYHAWGNTHHQLGLFSGNLNDFSLAKNKFKKALSLVEGKADDVIADLHWAYGDSWMKIAEFSGEAIDLNIALKAYEETLKLNEDLPAEFWSHYGQVAQKLSLQTNDLQLLTQAINCFKNSISISISSAQAWVELARALTILYSFTQDEDHFSQANECFATAVKFENKSAEIWIEWAQLLEQAGRQNKDSKKLRAAIEKCQRAQLCDPTNPMITAIWSMAQAELGCISDDLELIHEAQNKLSEMPHVQDSQMIILAEGYCLYNLGRYFHDLDYYCQSIEKFQEGLSLNRKNDRLWFHLGLSYSTVADLENNPLIFERCCKFFQKALHLRISSEYHYFLGYSLYRLGEEKRDQTLLQQSIYHFEQALSMQKNAIYLHPDWLFNYACALDCYADFGEEESYYTKALEILNHVLMVDPEFPQIHHQLALVFGHYGELTGDRDLFERSIHHYHIANCKEKENDQIILDWAITLINVAQNALDSDEKAKWYQEAEFKMMQAAKLGNVHAFYHLACLYSLTYRYEQAMHLLTKAFEYEALPSLQEISQDEWLENMQPLEEFQSFLQAIEASAHLKENESL